MIYVRAVLIAMAVVAVSVDGSFNAAFAEKKAHVKKEKLSASGCKLSERPKPSGAIKEVGVFCSKWDKKWVIWQGSDHD